MPRARPETTTNPTSPRSRARRVARADHGDGGRREHREPAAHREKRRSVVGRLQAARILGFAEGDQIDAEPVRGAQFSFGVFRGSDPDRARGPAAAGEIGQRRERGTRAAIVIEQRPEGARADILAADQPQPVEPLLVAQA